MAGGKRNRAAQSRQSNSSHLTTSVSSSSISAQAPGTASIINSLSESNLLALTKNQLKIECRKRGQKTSGNKVELLQRLGHKMTPNNILGSNTQSASRRKDAPPTANGNKPIKNQPAVTNTVSASQKEREREEREKLVIWKYPLKTLEYSCREIYLLLYTNGLRLMQYRKTVLLVTLLSTAVGIYLSTTGGLVLLSSLVWGLYWTGLGLLSSVGFGTGLHTFLIYLGPHIAKVTLAAYECGALNFPEPPYPDEIICPDEPDMTYAASLWNIMTKVRVEAMLWGAGTALGELPPYFMARASRLSGYDPNDEDDLREFEELQKKIRDNPDSMTIIDKMKSFVEKLVERVGFFGILACASIPNPLFDLAGITCGHFLVPFWTFFGATLIGKAIVKMHIQKLFVIIAFNETLIEKAVTLLAEVPVIGNKLQEPFKEFLNKQKTNLHRKPGSSVPSDQSRNLLSTIFEIFVIAMILYFLVSIVNSLAQSYHKRIHSHSRSSGKSKQASD